MACARRTRPRRARRRRTRRTSCRRSLPVRDRGAAAPRRSGSPVEKAACCTSRAVRSSARDATGRATTPAGGSGGTPRSTMPKATGSSPSGTRPSSRRRATRSGGSLDSPSSHSAPSRPSASRSARIIGEHVLDAVPADAHALDGRGMRRPPLAEVDREAPRGVTVEPPARSERLVEVGVLGELADHTGHASRSRPRVATRCSGTTFTSASTGMKFVSPAQRGTTCWWR